MTTPERQGKRVLRALRSVSVDAVAPAIAAEEAARGGLWCVVAGDLEFIPADGSEWETMWDDEIEFAQYVRWVKQHPERIHGTREAAVVFVRSRLGGPSSPTHS